MNFVAITMDLSMNDMITVIITVMLGVVLIGYMLIPVVTQVIADIVDPQYSTLIGVAVTITILMLAIYPAMKLVKNR